MVNHDPRGPRTSRRDFLTTSAKVGAGLAMVGAGVDLAPQATDASSPITLTYMGLKDSIDANLSTEIMELFAKQHPGVKVQWLVSPPNDDDFLAKAITVMSAHDSTVDIFDADVTWPPELVAGGWVADLTSYVSPELQKNYSPGMLSSDTLNGHLYAIPWFLDTGHLYYRSDLLAANGLQPAKTWPELVQHCVMIQKKDPSITGFVGCYAKGEQQLISMFLEFIHSNGGDWIDPKTGKCVINSPQNVYALQYMIDMLNKQKIMQAGILSMNLDTGRQIFTEGRALYHRNWNYVYAVGEDTAGGSKIAGKFGVTDVPYFPGHKTAPSAGGWQLVVNKYSKNLDMAIKLAAFMAGPVGLKYRALHGAFTVAYLPVDYDPQVVAVHPSWPLLANQGKNAASRGKTPYYTQASEACEEEVTNALTGLKSAQQALADASTKISDILSGQS